ncbi:MAG: hypothetical protein KME64_26745 [Scytonematopsis contorta HA4267-MV1]|jgi:hypothetical protein|nr:hypothetical protein [Scytonematopsis contorta HA4267-MV1]
MGKKSQQNFEQPKDPRVAATSNIWGLTVAIMAISIPLTGITRSPLIPLAALGGAAVGTVAVWRSDNKKYQYSLPQQQQIELLEERIANLEIIASGNSESDLLMKIKRLEANNHNDSKNNNQ